MACRRWAELGESFNYPSKDDWEFKVSCCSLVFVHTDPPLPLCADDVARARARALPGEGLVGSGVRVP